MLFHFPLHRFAALRKKKEDRCRTHRLAEAKSRLAFPGEKERMFNVIAAGRFARDVRQRVYLIGH